MANFMTEHRSLTPKQAILVLLSVLLAIWNIIFIAVCYVVFWQNKDTLDSGGMENLAVMIVLPWFILFGVLTLLADIICLRVFLGPKSPFKTKQPKKITTR